MKSLGILFRTAFVFIWCGSLYYDIYHQPRIGHEWYIYKLVMLTNLNFVILSVFSVLAFLQLFLHRSKAYSGVLDFTFHCTVFPVATITCLLFWILYAIEPELVMPAWAAQLIPDWLNHVTHTLPILYILLELLLIDKQPPSNRSCLSMALLHTSIYFAIIFVVRYIDGYWLYPILHLFSIEFHAATFALAVAGYYSLIRLSAMLSTSIHGTTTRTHAKLPKKYS